MLYATAHDGNDPKKLFTNLIASSPYLPQQYSYDGTMPTNFFNRFVQEVGCESDKSGIQLLGEQGYSRATESKL